MAVMAERRSATTVCAVQPFQSLFAVDLTKHRLHGHHVSAGYTASILEAYVEGHPASCIEILVSMLPQSS